MKNRIFLQIPFIQAFQDYSLPPPPSPQSFHLLAIVLLIGYFAENLSPLNTTKAPHLLFPEVVENPKNQSVFIGSNVTFNCTAMGLPTPTISWMKNNDSYVVPSDVRARVVSDNKNNKNNHSQLIITEVKKEDSGKYQCVASNSAGERTSSVAFLYIKELGKTPLHCWKSQLYSVDFGQ